MPYYGINFASVWCWKSEEERQRNNLAIYFRCYTVHVVKSLNYFTNHCTYINNRALLATQHNTACCHKTNWNIEINMTFNSVTLARTI